MSKQYCISLGTV